MIEQLTIQYGASTLHPAYLRLQTHPAYVIGTYCFCTATVVTRTRLIVSLHEYCLSCCKKNYKIYLLTALELTPGGGSKVHIYTHTHTHTHTHNAQNNTVKQNTQNRTYITVRIHKHNNKILVINQLNAQFLVL